MATLTITRIAHSTVLIDFDGPRVLTDPWFSEKPGYYHGEPYGITLQIRSLGDQQVVMNPQHAAAFCRIVHPHYAVPIHYAFTGGPVEDAQTLKYAGTPDEVLRKFQQATVQRAPETTVRILAPGEPLIVTE